MNQSGRTPLHAAAIAGDEATVSALLAGGAAVDAGDDQGFTPLHFAAQQHALAVATALLAAGASVDSVNAVGNTPLFVAVFNSKGRGEMVKLLRARGADPLHVNASGQTPTGLARLISNYDVAQYFEDVAT